MANSPLYKQLMGGMIGDFPGEYEPPVGSAAPAQQTLPRVDQTTGYQDLRGQAPTTTETRVTVGTAEPGYPIGRDQKRELRFDRLPDEVQLERLKASLTQLGQSLGEISPIVSEGSVNPEQVRNTINLVSVAEKAATSTIQVSKTGARSFKGIYSAFADLWTGHVAQKILSPEDKEKEAKRQKEQAEKNGRIKKFMDSRFRDISLVAQAYERFISELQKSLGILGLPLDQFNKLLGDGRNQSFTQVKTIYHSLAAQAGKMLAERQAQKTQESQDKAALKPKIDYAQMKFKGERSGGSTHVLDTPG